MTKYDWNTFRNYVAFLAGGMAPGTKCPHHDSELTSCYHETFLTWGHYHNNIVLFYHDSPITRSHFMDPTDRAIKGFYCTCEIWKFSHSFWVIFVKIWYSGWGENSPRGNPLPVSGWSAPPGLKNTNSWVQRMTFDKKLVNICLYDPPWYIWIKLI